MNQQSKAKFGVVKWIVWMLAILATVLVCQAIFGRPSFDPHKVAQAETRMWQAYYSGNRTQLGLELISLLRNQHGLPLLDAKEIAERLASSAMKFHSSRGNYENIVLGDLTEAYRLIKHASGGSFDPEDVARRELAWWVARRTPGNNSAEQVGEKIGELYAHLYGGDHPALLTAGVLRAKATKLRDLGGKDADWVRIEDLLVKSYSELKKAL